VDLAQVFIFVAGWVFFAAWGLALVVVNVVAFGRDLLSSTEEAEPAARKIAGGQPANHHA
jgi:hypothetical protein